MNVAGTIVFCWLEFLINYPLRPGLAIDVAVRYVQAYASGDIEYDGYTVNAGLLWQFGR